MSTSPWPVRLGASSLVLLALAIGLAAAFAVWVGNGNDVLGCGFFSIACDVFVVVAGYGSALGVAAVAWSIALVGVLIARRDQARSKVGGLLSLGGLALSSLGIVGLAVAFFLP